MARRCSNAAHTLESQRPQVHLLLRALPLDLPQEPERYAAHKDVVKRILAGEAPANLLELLRQYFLLTQETWGKDASGGNYPWLDRAVRRQSPQ